MLSYTKSFPVFFGWQIKRVNMLTVNKQKLTCVFLCAAVICVFLSVSLMKHGTPGSMYTGCFYHVYINMTQAALHNSLQKVGTFPVTVNEYVHFFFCRMTQWRARSMYFIFN